MTVEMTYVALKPLRVGGQRREPGELVPEAEDWPRVSAWVSQGRIAVVAKAAVDPDQLKLAEARYAAAKSEAQEESASAGNTEETVSESDEPLGDDEEVETFATGTGWYEIPGSDKKMRREEAIAYLANLEDGSEE